MRNLVLAAAMAAGVLGPVASPGIARAAASDEIDMACWVYTVAVTCSQKTGDCWVTAEYWDYIC